MVFQEDATLCKSAKYGFSTNECGFQSSLPRSSLNQILLILTLIFNRHGHLSSHCPWLYTQAWETDTDVAQGVQGCSRAKLFPLAQPKWTHIMILTHP